MLEEVRPLQLQLFSYKEGSNLAAVSHRPKKIKKRTGAYDSVEREQSMHVCRYHKYLFLIPFSLPGPSFYAFELDYFDHLSRGLPAALSLQ